MNKWYIENGDQGDVVIRKSKMPCSATIIGASASHG